MPRSRRKPKWERSFRTGVRGGSGPLGQLSRGDGGEPLRRDGRKGPEIVEPDWRGRGRTGPCAVGGECHGENRDRGGEAGRPRGRRGVKLNHKNLATLRPPGNAGRPA